jgi:uncharacterized protein (TIGR02271 family)
MDATSSQTWIGQKLVDRDGAKIGRVDEIYVDDRTGEPSWLTVHTGLLASRTNFVPLRDARMSGEDLQVPYTKHEVKDAPNIEPGGHLEPAEEQRLFQHYSMDWNDPGRTAAANRGRTTPADADRTAPTKRGNGRRRADGDRGMIRSEEELQVGKETVERGRARLRKYVVTEDVSQTVPVRRDEVRVEREPITDRNVGAARSGPSISEEEHEVVLHEERPVVQKEAVPVERVRLGTETVTEEETVSAEVRREQIDTDLDADPTPRPSGR